MVSSELLDVVIGVVFAWFILSLVVSLLGEALSWAAKTRSKLLWRSVGQLFDSKVEAADARLRTLLWNNPIGRDDIRPTSSTAPSATSKQRAKADNAVARTDAGVAGADGVPPTDDRPETDQAKSFVSELYNIVRGRVPDPAAGNWRTRISQIPTGVLGDAFQSLAARTVTSASLLSSIQPESQLPAALGELAAGPLDHDELKGRLTDPALSAEFETAWEKARRIVTVEDVEALLGGNQPLLARVRAAVESAGDAAPVVKAKAEVERWFDGAMTGLSTFYRRQNRKILALIALPVVLLANSSAFGLFERLQSDENVKNAAATAAATWAAEPLATTELGAIDLGDVCARIAGSDGRSATTAAPSTEPPSSVPGDETTEAVFAEVQRRFDCASELFSSSDLLTPFGPRALWNEIRDAGESDNVIVDLWAWRLDGLGRLVTWAALLFGASFWYDSLRRLVGLKGKLAARDGGSST